MSRKGEDVTDAPTDVQVDANAVEVKLLTGVDVTDGRELSKIAGEQSVKHLWQLCTVPLNDEETF